MTSSSVRSSILDNNSNSIQTQLSPSNITTANSGIVVGQNTANASTINISSSSFSSDGVTTKPRDIEKFASSSTNQNEDDDITTATTTTTATSGSGSNSSTRTSVVTNTSTSTNVIISTVSSSSANHQHHHRPTTVMITDAKTGSSREMTYLDSQVIGSGSFGIVYEATDISASSSCDNGKGNRKIAIKKVLQDRRFKNRELQIMRMIDHVNVVSLYSFFYSTGDKRDDIFLNLVLEHVPETIYKLARDYSRLHQSIPMPIIKLYTYQLFRSLAYIHALGIAHRDIKPQNLLINTTTGVLKICDFGSAKILIAAEPNVSYICSRYYRAPELIFGAVVYNTKIDVWSSGCVLAELVIGHPIFPGDSGVDQLVEIIKILGTPIRSQVIAMNPNYTDNRFPDILPKSIETVLGVRSTPELSDIIRCVIRYEPNLRLSAIETMAHEFFDEVRSLNFQVLGINTLPQLFNFTSLELSLRPDLNSRLIPQWI